MTDPHEFTDSVANTSYRKLLAFPLKNVVVLKLIHAIFRMPTTLLVSFSRMTLLHGVNK